MKRTNFNYSQKMSIRIPEATITLRNGNNVDGIICSDYRNHFLLLDKSTSSIIFVPNHSVECIDGCI